MASGENLQALLKKDRRRYVSSIVASSLVKWLGSALLFTIVLVTIAGLLGDFSRLYLLLFVLLLGAWGITGICFFVLPVSRIPSLEQFAYLLDGISGTRRQSFLSALQLMRREGESRFSGRLIQALVAEASERYLSLDKSVLRRGHLRKRWVAVGAGSAALAVTLLAVSPELVSRSIGKITHPLAYARPALEVIVSPGSVKLPLGSDLDVRATVRGSSRPEAKLFYRVPGEEWVSESMAKVAEHPEERSAEHFCQVQRIMDPLEYFVEAAGSRSDTFSVDVSEPLRLLGARITLRYPPYSRIKEEVFTGRRTYFNALKGTKVEVQIEMNQQVSGGWLEFSRDTVSLGLAGDDLLGSVFTVMTPDSCRLFAVDRAGREKAFGPLMSFGVLADEDPAVSILVPEEEVDLPADGVLPIFWEAFDDYGLKDLKIAYLDREKWVEEPVKRFLGVEKESKGSYLWNLEGFDLFPGDRVEYKLIVRDNDAVSGPKKAESRVHTVRFPTIEEIYAEAEREHLQETVSLRDILEEGKKLKEDLGRISREFKKTSQLSWEKKEKLSSLGEKQEKLAKQIKDIQASLEETMQKLASNDLVGLEVLERMERISELLKELSGTDFAERIKELSEALNKVDKSKLEQALRNMSLTQEQLLTNLERTIQMLERIRLEELMEAAVRKAGEMAERQRKLNEEVEGGAKEKPEEMASKQEDLAKQAKGLSKDLEKVEQLLGKYSKELSEEVGEVSQKLDPQLSGLMQAQSDLLKGDNTGRARRQCRRIASGLEQVSNRLSKLQKKMMTSRDEELARQMRQLAGEALIASEAEERLLGQGKRKTTSELAAGQNMVLEQSRGISSRLFEIAKNTFAVSGETWSELGGVLDNLERATRAWEQGRRSKGSEMARESMKGLNNVARSLIESSSSLMNSSSCMNQGACRQGLSSLGKAQSRINQETQGLLPLTGDRLTPDAEERMLRLAAEQEMVRKGLEELLKNMGSARELLGRLDELAPQMKQVERDLKRKTITERTLKEQERILSRLLDAQTSVKKRDYTRKRYSKPGREVLRRSSPAELPEEVLAREMWLRKAILRGKNDPVSPEYRVLVEKYFKRLSESGL